MTPPPEYVTVVGKVLDRPQRHPYANDTAARYRLLEETDRVVYNVVASGKLMLDSLELRRGDAVEVTGRVSRRGGVEGEPLVTTLIPVSVVALPTESGRDFGFGLI